MTVVKIAHSPLESLIGLLAHDQCIICGKDNIALCYACFHQEIFTEDSRCYMCNKLAKNSGICTACTSRLRRIWWLGLYKGQLKDLLWQMKFHRRRSHGRLFGTYLADTLPHLPAETLVIPVPTAPRRIRRRGFDQAKLIAQTIAEKRKLRFLDPLYRVSTVDLIGKTRTERRELMRESLAIKRQELLGGATVLLVDDVLTTGATIEAAAALLRKQGVKHVDGALVARQLPS